MVRELKNKGASDNFGIEGYTMPKSGSPKKTKIAGVIGRNKSPGPIEAEIKLRKNYPGAG